MDKRTNALERLQRENAELRSALNTAVTDFNLAVAEADEAKETTASLGASVAKLAAENAELRQANKDLASAAIADEEFQRLRADAGRYRWQKMATAPKDGTAILVLLTGSDIPKPARWFEAEHKRASAGAGWYITWDNYALTSFDGPRYWMPCPDDPDYAIDAARAGQK